MTFQEYLKKNNESPWSFAKRSFISLNTIYKLHKGGSVRKDTAKRIVRATKKLVTLEDLGYELRRLS